MPYQLFCHEICPLIKNPSIFTEKDGYTKKTKRCRAFKPGVNNIIPYINAHVPENLEEGIDVSTDTVACQKMIDRYGYALRRDLGAQGGDLTCPLINRDMFVVNGSKQLKNE